MIRPLVLINDVHGDTRTPAGRTDDWFTTITGKLEQVARAAIKIDAAAVCIAGDLFHPKTRVLGVWPQGTHEMVSVYLRWAAELQARDIKCLAIPGNHDLAFDRLDSLARQPLGALFASGLFTDVSYAPYGLETGDWVVCGVPYPDAKDLAAFARVAPVTRPGVLMAHCFADVRETTFFGEPVHSYASIHVPGYQVYHFGHDHADHGIVQVEDRTYVQVGALGRGSLAGEEVNRKPQLVILQQENGVVTARPIALRVQPAAEVFNFAAKERRDTEASVVAAFVAHLDAAQHTEADVMGHLQGLGLAPEVLARVQGYLERADEQATA